MRQSGATRSPKSTSDRSIISSPQQIPGRLDFVGCRLRVCLLTTGRAEQNTDANMPIGREKERGWAKKMQVEQFYTSLSLPEERGKVGDEEPHKCGSEVNENQPCVALPFLSPRLSNTKEGSPAKMRYFNLLILYCTALPLNRFGPPCLGLGLVAGPAECCSRVVPFGADRRCRGHGFMRGKRRHAWLHGDMASGPIPT